ncbi:MAG: transcriptional regulator NrdR [Planctomycetia bacterium]
MKCPFCQHPDTKVVSSRATRDGRGIRRRRHCPQCSTRFSTEEAVLELVQTVVKRDLSRVPFDRDKLLGALKRALYKRPVTDEKIDQLLMRVEARIVECSGAEVMSSCISEMVMDELRELDHVAYIRYASDYREFQELEPPAPPPPSRNGVLPRSSAP